MAASNIINPYEQIWKTRDLRALDTPVEIDNKLPEWRRGLGAFGKEMQATGYGLVGLGAQGVENLIGENAVTSGLTDWGIEGYNKAIQESQTGLNAPSVAGIEKIKNASDLMDWAGYQLGKGIPMLGTLALSGGVGGAIARIGANQGIKALAKSAVGDLVKKTVATKAIQAAEGQAVTQAMKTAAATALRDTFEKGAIAGGYAGSFGLEGGLAFGEQVSEGVNPADAVKSAIAVGGINGALEFLPFYSAAKSIGMGSYAKKSIAKVIADNPELSKRAIGLAAEVGGRALKGAAVGAGAEGITEGLQELVSIAGLRWAENEPLFADLTPEDWRRIKNAAAAGALVGSVAAGAGATIGGPQTQEVTPPPAGTPPTAGAVPPAGTPPVQTGTPPVTPPTNQTRTQDLKAMRSRIDAALIEAQAAGNTADVEELQQIKARFDNELGVETPVQETPGQVAPVQEAPAQKPPVEVPPVIQTIPPTQEVTPPVRETPLDIPPVPPVTPQESTLVSPTIPIALTLPTGLPRPNIADPQALGQSMLETALAAQQAEKVASKIPTQPEVIPNAQEVQTQAEAPVNPEIPNVPGSDNTRFSMPRRQPNATEATMEEFEAVRKQFQERQKQETPFKNWFGKGTPGVTADSAGTPITLYHGTNNPEFNKWDSSRAGEASSHPTSGLGFFMTADKGAAARYGSNLMALHAKIQNPYELTDADLTSIETKEDAAKLRKKLMSKGYDGAVVKAPGAKPYVIAFDSKQVKFVTNEKPTDSEDFRYSMPKGKPAPTFYSALERATKEAKQEKAPAVQWESTLDNLVKKGLVKQEELDWSGTKEWLKEQKGPVTKEALLQHVRNNTLNVQETTLGAGTPKVTLNNNTNKWEVYDLVGKLVGTVDNTRDNSEAETLRVGNELSVLASPFYGDKEYLPKAINTKWTEPGGTNQRELVLTVPSIEPFNTDTTHYGDVGGGKAVAWVRFNDRVDGDGKKTLFIEEIQSKRHQEGRERGYTLPTIDTTGWTAIDDSPSAPTENKHSYYVTDVEGRVPGREVHYLAYSPEEAIALAAQDAKEIADGVPDAPFKQTIAGSGQTLSGWAGLVFKRMLKYAVENGYDKVAFTNGEQQAIRYNQQKHIKTIESFRKPKNNYLIKTITYDDVIESSYIPAESISEKVGNKFSNEIINSKKHVLTFTDVNLKIGGEKLKKLYDEILPTEINKYVKKWGVKVDKTQMKFGNESASVHSVEITPAMRDSVMQGQPLFSQAPTTETSSIQSVTPDELRANINSVMGENWIQQAESAGIIEVIDGAGTRGESGSWAGDKFRLYTQTMPAGGSPLGVLLHEGSHAPTFNKILGDSFEEYLKDLDTLAENGNKTAQNAIAHATIAVADVLGIKHNLMQGGNKTDLKNIQALIEERQPGLLAEEKLAYFIQYAAETKDGAGFLKRLINAIKAWFAQTKLGQALKEAGIGFELNEAMAVEWAKASLRNSLAEAQQAARVREKVIAEAKEMPPSVRLGRALEAQYSFDGSMQDAEYLAAVERGDMEEVQRLVDEAAKAAGYTIAAGHKSKNRFTEFDRQRIGTNDFGYAGRGFYFTPNEPMLGESYGSESYKVFLNLDNPYRRTQDNWKTDQYNPYTWIANRSELLREEGADVRQSLNQASQDWTDLMVSKGYDGFVDEFGSEIVVFSTDNMASKIKLADPITYNNAGNVIPLSQRFNPNQDDIRYSLDTTQYSQRALPSTSSNAAYLEAQWNEGGENITKNKGAGGRDTSIMQLPAGADWLVTSGIAKPGTVHLDVGAGKFDKMQLAYQEAGIISIPVDPFNRSELRNRQAYAALQKQGGAETASSYNVLNVVKDLESALNVVRFGYGALKPGGVFAIGVYEGNRKGVWDGSQHNRPLKWYEPFVKAAAPDAEIEYTANRNDSRKELMLVKKPVTGEVEFAPYVHGYTPIGKNVAGSTYVHRDYIDQSTMSDAQKSLAKSALSQDTSGIPFNLVAVKNDASQVILQESPDFDTANEPYLNRTITYAMKDGKLTVIRSEKGGYANPKILHGKHAWVGEDYSGFGPNGYVEAEQRYSAWKTADVVKRAGYGLAVIGRRDAWTDAITRVPIPDIYYSMGLQEFKDTLWTDPTDSRQDFVNKPGLLQKFRANFIDFFAEMEKKSTRVYDAYSLLRNKKAARLVQARQEYMFPLRDLIAKGPWTSKEVGDMLAARHLKVDNVNTRLAERSSYIYTKELLKALPESKKKELMKARVNIKGGKMPDGSVYLDANGTPARMSKTTKQKLMFDLMNKYVVFEQLNPDGKQALRFEWEVFKDAAGGFSNGGIGRGIVRSIDDVLADTSKDQARFDKIANLFDAMNRHALQIREDGGLITPEEHARLLLDKTAYAPLRRESYNVDREIEQLFQRAGQGGSKQLGTRTGTTALSEPTLVLQNALAALEASAAAAERNLANKELYEVINDDREGWKPWFAIVDADKYMTHDEDGFLQEINATASNRADITLINKGKKLVIRPNMHNERAMGFVRAANNLDAQIVSGPMSVLNFFNNIVRWVNVTASPAFLLMNMIRDPGTALYNLQATEAAPYTSEIFANYGKSFKALKKVFLDGNRDPTDADVKMVEAFEDAGGRTSFIEQLNPSDDTWRSFDAQVARRQGSMKQIMAAKDKWIDGLENFNVLFENVMRLSTFNVLVSKGVDKTRAARIAQDLTTNFTRRGYKTQALGNWWVFFNATVQGNYQVLRNMLASKRLMGFAGATIAFAVILDLFGRAVADDWDEIPEWDKERFIILPIKAFGDFIKIPAPWVYNVLWRMGGMFGETLAGVRKPQDMVLDLTALSAVTFSPLGKPGSIAQLVSPTAADPFVQILENKDFAGNPIGPEGFPGAGNKANSELLWSSTPKGYQSVARLVNEWTGGSAVESGVIDLRPGDYQLLAKFLTGSLGRFLSDATFGLKENLEEGIEGPKEIPILKEFFSEPYNPMRAQTYHTNIAAVYGAHKLEKMYREGPERDLVKLQEVRNERSKDLRMYNQAQDVERQLKSLRVRIRAAENRNDNARVKELRGRMEDVQERFNAAYKQRVG